VATIARDTIGKDQPHRLETLAGVNAPRLFDVFEETKKGCAARQVAASPLHRAVSFRE
jgi:hypothetical protein